MSQILLEKCSVFQQGAQTGDGEVCRRAVPDVERYKQWVQCASTERCGDPARCGDHARVVGCDVLVEGTDVAVSVGLRGGRTAVEREKGRRSEGENEGGSWGVGEWARGGVRESNNERCYQK